MSENAIVSFMKKDQVLENFAMVLGSETSARSYIFNVIVAVSSNPRLEQCSRESVYKSALRSATLRLSVDPSSRQAYLVPYKDQCTLIVGYKGYYDLAMRTGQYRWINIAPIHEGETAEINRLTGRFEGFGGKKTSNAVAGYLGAFEMTNGFHHAIYMSVEEIHAHKEKYAQGFNRNDSAWKTATEKMEKKTVLLQLLRGWGTFDPADQAVLTEIEGETQMIEAPEFEEAEYVEDETPRQSKEQNLYELGYDPKPTNDDVVDVEPGQQELFPGIPEWANPGLVRNKKEYDTLCAKAQLDADAKAAILKECGGDISTAYDAVLAQYGNVMGM